MDVQQFLAQLPQYLGQKPSTEQLDAVDGEIEDDPTPDPVLGLITSALQTLEPGELYCQIGVDDQAILPYLSQTYPQIKTVSLPGWKGDLKPTEQTPEQILSQWPSRWGSERIGICFLPWFTDYRSHLLSLLHCRPWLADRAVVITTGARWSGLRQANLDFLGIYPQARIGLNLGLEASPDSHWGEGVQILIWESATPSPTEAQHWQIYRRISRTLITHTSPTQLRFRSPQTTFSSQILCLEDLLSPQENLEIYDHAIRMKDRFHPTGFYSQDADLTQPQDRSYRRSLKLDLEMFPQLGDRMRQKVLEILPQILPQFGLDRVELTGTEMELVAHNHDHHYGIHYDNATPETETRVLSYLYYFHADPKPFGGGQLRVYDTERDPETEQRSIQGYFNEYVPQNNCLVFFQSSCIHEVLPVICPSGQFEDSRFTLNGWIRAGADP